MPEASIVYWYAGEQMRLDGGGLRIVAWQAALESMGYRTRVVPLWSIGGGVQKGGRVSAAKRLLLPMPLARSVPDQALDADLVVATVPAVFGDALDRAPSRLVLDWMDLWSVASRNMGDAGRLSVAGGRLQARLWAHRERRWTARSRANVYAGFDDLERMSPHASGGGSWIPTPVQFRGRQREPREIKRLGFVGNLDYPPNEMSLRAFLRDYSPALEAQGIELVVAGFGSAKVGAWGYPVRVLGEVDHVDEFYDSIDASVVPIDHGSGIKVKAVEAMAYGVPVFSTDHVRAGFSPDLRAYLPDISSLRQLSPEPMEMVPETLFRRYFDATAFNRAVAGLLKRL